MGMSTRIGLGVIALVSACSSETPGRIVDVRWQFDQNLGGDNADFETETGFQVHLEDARLALGAVYAFSPAPSSTRAVAQLRQWLLPVAHAHGGLDPETGRKVLAELPRATLVDALAEEPRRSALTTAEAGALDALKLVFADSDQPEFQGGSVFVRGQAERAGETWAFEAAVTLDAAPKVRSVDLTGLRQTLDDGALLKIGVRPREWFRLCEFAQLPATPAAERVVVTADTQVGRALVIGVRSPEAFSLSVGSDE